jgi:short-subunit dehydrogenase
MSLRNISNAQYGPWALITGGSSGIGKAFAEQLAAHGLNLILVARRQPLLDQAAKEIGGKYGVQVKTISADLSDLASVEALKAETQPYEIGLFIPNAGIENHGEFIHNDLNRETKIIRLNIMVPMQLAHHYSRKMAERGRGGIIFVSSTLGYSGVPYFSNYAATKAYVLAFGEGLSYEMKSLGVDVTVLSPGGTDTPMADNMGFDMKSMPFPMMTPEDTAVAGLKALGKKTSVIPGFQNNVMTFMSTRLMPRGTTVSMFGGLLKKALDGAKAQVQQTNPSNS